MESALHSLPKSSDNGDDGWTDEDMAELEKEPGLALGEHRVESSSAGTPTAPSPRSTEAAQDEIWSRRRSKTAVNRPEELRDASRYGTAQGLKEWKLQETGMVVEGGAVGDQQVLVKVIDADDPKDKEPAEALPAAQPNIPEIDEHRFRPR